MAIFRGERMINHADIINSNSLNKPKNISTIIIFILYKNYFSIEYFITVKVFRCSRRDAKSTNPCDLRRQGSRKNAGRLERTQHLGRKLGHGVPPTEMRKH